jgi:energy-coupling factor transporter transmembrane protein EcfT
VVSWRWFLIMGLLILPSMLWVGNAEPIAAGIPFSTAGLILGLQMACRATAIYMAVGVFSQTVSVTDLTIFFERLGLRGVGFALGVGFHALPTLRRRLVTAYAALRLRGGFRRQRWRAIQLLLTTLILGALRYGEDVVMAAEARGFQPDQD